jgi:hypothetical protein
MFRVLTWLCIELNLQQWMVRCEELQQYIASNGQLPSRSSAFSMVKQLGEWLRTQKQNYKQKTQIMKDHSIRTHWDAFMKQHPHLFLTHKHQWRVTLEHLQQYIAEHDQLPSEFAPESTVEQLGEWVSIQTQNYGRYTNVMKDQDIRALWEAFMRDYPRLFLANADHGLSERLLTNAQHWMVRFEDLKRYIAFHGCLPSRCTTANSLSTWVLSQKQNYKQKSRSMKDRAIRTHWEAFVNHHPHLFISNEQQWIGRLEDLQQYIAAHGRFPSQHSSDPAAKQLGTLTLSLSPQPQP